MEQQDMIKQMIEMQAKIKVFNERDILNQCDLCGILDEVLIEKPLSTIVNGELFVNHRPKPLWICLDCLKTEIENF